MLLNVRWKPNTICEWKVYVKEKAIKLSKKRYYFFCLFRKMDHHCPWINNCVGEDNQKFFVLFTMYIFLISMYALVLTIRQILVCTENEWHDCTFLPVASAILLMIFLVFEGLLFGIFTLVMFCSQVSSIVKDETGIENLKKERVVKKTTVYENLQDVFGGYFSISWFSPFTSPPLRRTNFTFHDVWQNSLRRHLLLHSNPNEEIMGSLWYHSLIVPLYAGYCIAQRKEFMAALGF